MRLLVALGYRTIPLDDLLAARASATALPKRSVVLTFDDGFADAIRYAVPLLTRYGLTATFFIVAALIGKTSEWTLRTRGIAMPLADASRLRDLAAAGFTIGSHALTHRPLAELQENESRHELTESKRRLEDLLHREVAHLAYPYGSTNDFVRAAAAECGYQTACATRPGLSPAADDLHALRRVIVAGEDSLADFACRLRTGDPFRSLAQRFRVTMKVSAFAR